MEQVTLNSICNVIILIGAVILAIKNIYGFFKKPVTTLQTKVNDKEEKHIEEVIDRRVPELLTKHSHSVRDERQAEDQKMIETIKTSVVEALDYKIEELKNMTLEQDEQLVKISKSMQLLNSSQLDVMRYNMNRIYSKYRPYKKILDYDKKAFMRFYQDYHSMGGNTWIDSLYKEVITWEIVEDEAELKN